MQEILKNKWINDRRLSMDGLLVVLASGAGDCAVEEWMIDLAFFIIKITEQND
jgi:hypothetical protein